MLGLLPWNGPKSRDFKSGLRNIIGLNKGWHDDMDITHEFIMEPTEVDPEPLSRALPAKLGFPHALLLTLLSHQALRHRRQRLGLQSRDMLFNREGSAVPVITPEFVRYQALSTYCLDLVFSSTPSSFRGLTRPVLGLCSPRASHAEPGNSPVLVAPHHGRIPLSSPRHRSALLVSFPRRVPSMPRTLETLPRSGLSKEPFQLQALEKTSPPNQHSPTPVQHGLDSSSLLVSSPRSERDGTRRSSSPFRAPQKWKAMLRAGFKEIDLRDAEDAEGENEQQSVEDSFREALARFRDQHKDDQSRACAMKLVELRDLTLRDLEDAEKSLNAAFEAALGEKGPIVLIERAWELLPGSWKFAKLIQHVRPKILARERR